MSRQKEKALIKDFGEAQIKKLDLRSDKGRLNWRKKSMYDLLEWLDGEIAELHNEIVSPEIARDLERIKDEAVDVANLSMMIWDKVNQDE